MRIRHSRLAHPRMGREQIYPVVIRAPGPWIIPAWAGNTPACRYPNHLHGFIPAQAGSTSSVDFPNNCWGKFIPAPAGNSISRRAHPERDRRFIPACAGNTFCNTCKGKGRHGSSPRWQGVWIAAQGLRVERRFIPALAGSSTRRRPASCLRTGAHPRIGGGSCSGGDSTAGGVPSEGHVLAVCLAAAVLG